MPKTYKWKADTAYQSPTTLSYGVTPTDHTEWQDTEAGHQSGSWSYWYRDANVEVGGAYTDANSTRCVISLTESWDAEIDAKNNLIISIVTTVNSIVRDDVRGINQATPGRNITIYQEQGGSPIISVTDNDIASAHTIYEGPTVLNAHTFTLAPGESLQRSSLYLHNQTVGGVSYDDIWFGVSFMNDLPKDYRPGMTLKNGIWQSHNRTNGACHLYTGSNVLHEMRTEQGGEGGRGNPPLILNGTTSNDWFNQRKIGKEE